MAEAVTKRVLLSLAHPDDETFGMGGLVAKYVAEGAEVYLICSTNGDVGTVDAEFMEGYQTIAELRLAELQCAAQTLGFTEVFTLGYRDSGMPGSEENQHPDSLCAAEEDDVTGRIVEIIRKVRPQVVITFDPYGGYGHPDHIKMYELTTRAFEEANNAAKYVEQAGAGLKPFQPVKLYYSTFDRSWLRFVVKLLPLFGEDPEKFGRNKDINLKQIADHSYPAHARINVSKYKAIAEQATNCHASQLGGFSGNKQSRRSVLQIVQSVFTFFTANQHTLMRAYPPVNGNKTIERDLFEGLKEI